MKIFISLLLLYMLSGCGSPMFYVNIRSEPEGALIQTGYKPSDGYSNVTLPLLYEAPDQNGCIHWAGPITAYWASGASAQISPLSMCQGPKTYEFVLKRPVNHPNLDVDIKFLFSLNQAMRQQKLRSRREADAAFDEFVGLLLGAQQRSSPAPSPSPNFIGNSPNGHSLYIINGRHINCHTAGSTVICN